MDLSNMPIGNDSPELSLRKIQFWLSEGLPPSDHITLSPPEKPTTITYRMGGETGTVVATVTLTYSGDDVATISRS
jgi:hypothetical protein